MNNLNPNLLKAERKVIINDTVRGTCMPKRVPILSMSRAWPILDAGYTLLDCFMDYDKMQDAMLKFQAKYQFDYYTSLTRFNYKVTETMGGGGLIVNNELGSVQFTDEILLHDDEFRELIAMGKDRFIFEKCLPRKYGLGKVSREEALNMLSAALKENYVLSNANNKTYQILRDEYGLLKASGDSFFYKTPIDTVQSAMRGLKNLALDMRRRANELKEVLAVMDAGALDATLNKLAAVDINDPDLGFHAATTSTTIWQMSAKQFEMFDRPYIQKFYDKVVDENELCLIFPEGGYMHLLDYYADLPKGHFALMSEMESLEDLKMVQQKAPNLVIIGGMPLNYLGRKTKDECLTKAKEVIDTLGIDGRLIFSSNKMLSTMTDAKGKNLQAVNEFVLEYGRYR